MNESGVLDHGLRSAHEPPSTSVGGGQRLIAPQHLTPAATAQGSERKRPAAPSGGSRSGQLRGDDMYSNSESGRPAKTMVAAPSSARAHHVRPPPRDPPASRLPAFPVRRRSPNRALDHHLRHLACRRQSLRNTDVRYRAVSGGCSSRFGLQRRLFACCRSLAFVLLCNISQHISPNFYASSWKPKTG